MNSSVSYLIDGCPYSGVMHMNNETKVSNLEIKSVSVYLTPCNYDQLTLIDLYGFINFTQATFNILYIDIITYDKFNDICPVANTLVFINSTINRFELDDHRLVLFDDTSLISNIINLTENKNVTLVIDQSIKGTMNIPSKQPDFDLDFNFLSLTSGAITCNLTAKNSNQYKDRYAFLTIRIYETVTIDLLHTIPRKSEWLHVITYDLNGASDMPSWFIAIIILVAFALVAIIALIIYILKSRNKEYEMMR